MKYTRSHEWIKIEGDEAKVGISNHFQAQLDEIVYVELPKVGHVIKKGEGVAVLESTKAAIDITTPVSGTISAVNHLLLEEPGCINQSAEREGWIFKIKLTHPEECDALLDAIAYAATIL